jgi:hypothetical protein
MTEGIECERLVTESAHGVRRRGGIVASEGGGQRVPTLGGGASRSVAEGVTAEKGSSQ